MQIEQTALPGVVILTPQRFGDERGWFSETWNAARMAAAGLDFAFVQDNQSTSRRHVLRGLHYQEPNPQGKLVRALAGAIYDVAADIRTGSPTFGRWVGVQLTAENRRQLWIPPGFAHGYLALTDAEVLYKATDFYAPAHEHCLAWDDPTVAIDWPLTEPPIVSARDRQGARLDRRVTP